jgi:hypothetical protein
MVLVIVRKQYIHTIRYLRCKRTCLVGIYPKLGHYQIISLPKIYQRKIFDPTFLYVRGMSKTVMHFLRLLASVLCDPFLGVFVVWMI